MGEARKVLVVDDDDGVRDAVRDVLAQSGYVVDCAADGVEALSYMTSIVPELVVLDLRMPGCDGFEVLERMQRDDRLRATPVLIFSVSTPPDPLPARVRYLRKPATCGALALAVRDLL